MVWPRCHSGRRPVLIWWEDHQKIRQRLFHQVLIIFLVVNGQPIYMVLLRNAGAKPKKSRGDTFTIQSVGHYLCICTNIMMTRQTYNPFGFFNIESIHGSVMTASMHYELTQQTALKLELIDWHSNGKKVEDGFTTDLDQKPEKLMARISWISS